MLLGVGMVQVVTRDGFDLDRHALSQLSLGPWGFVQIANFLVTGALVIAAARRLRGVPGAVWGPRLLAGFGAGMLVAGVFVADPAFGFPVGTPGGPGSISWHGVLHTAGFTVAMVSWTAAMIVLARGDRARAAVCVTALVIAAGVATVPVLGSFGLRALVVSGVQLAALALLCAKALRAPAPSC
ncbi:DUF998 domain-containing protein [Winogradskya humida]|uniref:DUF998 domain-containing protein n=1 Tax=Winogradskya humida TaxID=113566 RepID=UPI001944DB25